MGNCRTRGPGVKRNLSATGFWGGVEPQCVDRRQTGNYPVFVVRSTFTLHSRRLVPWMPGDPHSGSNDWEAPDREIGKPGENRGKVIAHLCFGDFLASKLHRHQTTGRGNGLTPSLPTQFLEMAIQCAEAQTSTLAKLAAAYTAAHKLGHQLLNFRTGTSLGR